METTDAKGCTVTNEIGDIDSGDTHHFRPRKRSCIVWVRPSIVVLGKTSAAIAGEPVPLWFQVDFWEKDWSLFGFPRKALRLRLDAMPVRTVGTTGTAHALYWPPPD